MARLSSAFAVLVIATLPIWFSSCLVSKPPETNVHVTLDETVPIKITKDAGASFVTLYTDDEYRKIFLSELKRLLPLYKVIVSDSAPQFHITISQLELQEVTTTDTVKDEKSKDNGRVFNVAVGKLRSSGQVVTLATQQSNGWEGKKEKRERVTSLQSLGQMVQGENKDLNEYRKKDFDRNEFVSLSGQCGQEAAQSISKMIRRQLK